MKKYTKTIFKEFKTGFGRFIAIMAIIALGVGFMVGLSQATPDMKTSMTEYFSSQNAYDVNVKSVYGLTDDDLQAISELEYKGETLVEKMYAYISTDAPVSIEYQSSKQTASARIRGVNFETLTGENGVNNLTVEEGGRLPENETECVVQRENNNFKSITIGTTITITGEGTLGNDIYTQTEFTVVGIVSSPEYYYLDASEQTTIGTGVIGAVVYVDESAYDLSANVMFSMLGVKYTDADIILKGSDKYQAFTDNYDEYVSERSGEFATLGSSRCESINAMLAMYLGENYTAAQWYSLDIVSSNVSYIGFEMNADKVTAIAGIFPVFFIVVAALVALTSMTRMVEEDRLQIGTLKALGYSNARIVNKYIIYCCVASFIGCTVGLLLGFSIFPTVIWEAYKVLYYLPDLVLAFSPLYSIVVLAIALALTIGVTLYASRPMFVEKPSQMMMPKAPKAGKRILLERVPFVWKRLKFKHKATIRNIFRYKKNMFMTIISVMGCTALIFVGFALSNSISVTIDLQFTEIENYDVEVRYEAVSENSVLESLLRDNDYYALYAADGNVVFADSGKSESVTLYGIFTDGVNEYIDIRGADGNAIDLTGGGAAICKNYADEHGVSVGDTITYRATDGAECTVTITAIAENYFGGCLYVYGGYLADNMGYTSPNACVIKMSEEYDTAELSETLYSDSNVTGVTFKSEMQSMYSSLDEIMGYIIALLVVSAGALAAIVLYNLTNINIDERRKEIATLKVLGYTKLEVAGYIYRESAALTIVGTLLGLLLGWLLNKYAVYCIGGGMAAFVAVSGVWSFVASVALTLAFAAIVYAFMTIKLNRVNMADSLKSNE